MKINYRNLIFLKPFDEAEDEEKANMFYAKSKVIVMAIAVCALASLIALWLLLGGHHELGLKIMTLSAGGSAVVSGIEWNNGLKARSLNHLLSALITVVVFGFIYND